MMGLDYDEQLKKVDEILKNIESSYDIDEEELKVVKGAVTEKVDGSIWGAGEVNLESTAYEAFLIYTDKIITEVLSNAHATDSEYQKAVAMCGRQEAILQLFAENHWSVPQLNNKDLRRCREELKKQQEETGLVNKIIENDKRIDELYRKAESELSVELCDTVLELLKTFSEDLAVGKKRRIVPLDLICQDPKKLIKETTAIRKEAVQKEALYQRIHNIEVQITNIDNCVNTNRNQWKEVISFCQKHASYVSECVAVGWPLPDMQYNNSVEITDKYNHYLSMANLDDEISAARDALSTQKQYQIFFANCQAQQANMKVCDQKGWARPYLTYTDLDSLVETVHAEKSRADRKKRFRKKLGVVAVITVAALALVLFGIHKYREGKIKVPFDAAYAVGRELNDVCTELENAGFVNIKQTSSTSGWADSNSVIGVTVNNSGTYSKNKYVDPACNVEVIYSSADRVYITPLLKDWGKTNYKDLMQELKSAGFTRITTEEVSTGDKEMNGLTAGLSLNSLEFTDEECYLPKNAPIIISYYVLKIGMGGDSSQFVGLNYEDVVERLEASGFTNVQTEKVNTGWEKGNTVLGVTVNNNEEYDSGTSFKADAKIIVKYSSDDRLDATAIFENWQGKDYGILQKDLKDAGFTNVSVIEKNTTSQDKNHLVASVTINEERFASGDCFIQKAAPISIEYYVIKLEIGTTASEFVGEQYKDVVTALTDRGFTNIQLVRADDLRLGLFAKEGAVKSVTVNDKKDFAEEDVFYFDDPIVIMVHTYKNKGCEEITQVAE